MSLGFDINRFIRLLNPTQTFFISTQFFYKHIFDSPGDLVLPVPFRNVPVSPKLPIVGNPNDPAIRSASWAAAADRRCRAPSGPGGQRPGTRACNLQPRFYQLHDDRFLQTLLITTAYSGGRIVPSFGMFYDWQAAGCSSRASPSCATRSGSPWTTRRSGAVAARQFGAVRDKDNVRFQVEYVF